MPGIVVLHSDLEALVDPGAMPEKIAGDCIFTEGPLWGLQDSSLTFSDVRSGIMYRWTEAGGKTVYRDPSQVSNGNTRDLDGNLITCEHSGRRISRTLANGQIETVVDNYQGKRLNSPNDVICCANGDLIFTDPPYGLRQPDGTFGAQEVPFCGVFRWRAADGSLEALVTDMERPNGLVLNADESQLLVCDTQEHIVRAFDVASDGSVGRGRLFVDVSQGDVIGRPDGMKMDSRGNLYVTANTPHGVWVFDQSARHLGFIEVGEAPANCAWGGPDWRTLFVTANTSVYRVAMRVQGQALHTR